MAMPQQSRDIDVAGLARLERRAQTFVGRITGVQRLQIITPGLHYSEPRFAPTSFRNQ